MTVFASFSDEPSAPALIIAGIVGAVVGAVAGFVGKVPRPRVNSQSQ
jgi:hypothetical protein